LSNQTLLWASFVVSWLSLLFLKQTEIRRYMPVALFGGLVTTIVMELGITLHWWLPTETVFPFVNMSIFTYGPYLIGIIWIFTYTYGRFWLFMVTNAVTDFILTFLLANWFVQIGIFQFYIPSYQLLLMALLIAVLLYGYQLWQTGAAGAEALPGLQPAAGKPLPDKRNDRQDKP